MSDSDSVISTADTLTDSRESSAKLRRDNAAKTKGMKGVRRAMSLNAKQSRPYLNGGGRSAAKLSLTDQPTTSGRLPAKTGMSESQTLTPPNPSSRQTPDRPGTEEMGAVNGKEGEEGGAGVDEVQLSTNGTTEDDRMVMASVKISRQVKRNNSTTKSPRASPRPVERNISTPTNRRI